MLHLFGHKKMNSKVLNKYLIKLGNEEIYKAPHAYLASARASLIANGYDMQWVNTVFTNAFIDAYPSADWN